MAWHYEKMTEDGKVKVIYDYYNDTDRSVTGKYVMNVKAYFDENPEERIRLGWTKHITLSQKEIDAAYPCTQSQYRLKSTRQVDENTIEDVYYVMDKTEEQMLLEEMAQGIDLSGKGGTAGIVFYGGE